MKKSVVCTGLLFLGMTAYAGTSPWTIAINPGYAMPLGETNDTMNNDFGIDGAAEYAINPALSLGFEAGYSSHKAEGTVRGISFTSDIEDSILHATPYLKLGHNVDIRSTKVRAYIFGGVGYYRLYQSDGTILILGAGIPVESDSDNFSGMNVGGGFDIPFDEDYTIGVILHYHRVFEPGTDDQLFLPGLRLGYTF